MPWKEISFDGYIDDIIAISLNRNENTHKSQEAVPLVVHGVYRPLCKNEPTIRDDPLSLRKLSGEGTPSERKTVLGWLIDTRAFRVFLSPEKAILWTKQIDNVILSKQRISSKTLESLFGRLNHVGFILPHARYFINRLRYLLSKYQSFGPQHVNERVEKDLLLWKKTIIFRLPNWNKHKFNNIHEMEHPPHY